MFKNIKSKTDLLIVLEIIFLAGTLVISCNDKSPVSSNEIAKVYKNYELYGELKNGSGIYYTITLPTTTTKVIMVRVRKDDDSPWEEWSDWTATVPVYNRRCTIHVEDYNLQIGGWEYWITVRAWEIQ